MHSEAIHATLADSSKPLQNEITLFKKQVREISTYCVSEDQEWLFQTCYARANRLKTAAVNNKHAAIQGLPSISNEEAEVILTTILEMKGTRTKKQRIAHDEATLSLIPKPLTFKGAAKNWHRDMAKHEDWTAFDMNTAINRVPQQPLNSIVCPICMESNQIICLKLSVRANFSNLKCTKCKYMNSTRKWGCECGELW